MTAAVDSLLQPGQPGLCRVTVMSEDGKEMILNILITPKDYFTRSDGVSPSYRLQQPLNFT